VCVGVGVGVSQIHIFNKQAVGHRLAVSTRAFVYGEQLVYSGPRVAGANATTDGSVVVSFGPIGLEGKGMVLRGGYGFEVRAIDGRWRLAEIVANSSRTVTVVAINKTGLTLPITGVRYGHDDDNSAFVGTGPAVFNGEGLPSTPWNLSVGEPVVQ
jgi:hypothetical protein